MVVYNHTSEPLIFYFYSIPTGKSLLQTDLKALIDNDKALNEKFQNLILGNKLEICIERDGAYYTKKEIQEIEKQEQQIKEKAQEPKQESNA